MRVALGSDHGGFELKEAIKKHLNRKGIEFADYGTFNNDSVDYPDYGRITAEAILSGECDRGIVCCGTGIGISITANRFNGIRAALCHNIEYARLAREHNDANILALGGRFTDASRAVEILKVFLNTEFKGGRHLRRVKMIDKH